MIYLEIAGRMGNQMFRYSFARKVQKITNQELVIDFKRVYDKNNKHGYFNALKQYNINNYIEVYGKKREYFYKNATFNQMFLYFFYRIISKILKGNKKLKRKFQLKFQPLMNKYNLFYIEQGFYNYDFSNLKNTKVIYICGCFESSKYFESIKEVIIKDFDYPLNKINNKKLVNLAKKNNSVAISIRRGDFVSNKNNEKIYNVCSIEYYEKAIAIMKNKLYNPIFLVFSDDIEWVKRNIDFLGCDAYSGEENTVTLAEKIKLMSLCKNFIISNSTFSWWGQYLSNNKSKIVISPSHWYKIDMPSDLLDDSWIKINTESFKINNNKKKTK